MEEVLKAGRDDSVGGSVRYELVRELGRGGMAVVFEARDRSNGRAVALKRLLPELATRAPHTVRLFEREFHTLVQLGHPRVIQAYDYEREEAGAFYTMELLDGGDLRALSPLPWQRVCGLLMDVCSALSLLHSRRLVHRDLTPRNVRCTQDGEAKLIDFGAMCPFGPTRQIVGTPAFTAPEALNQQSLDARTDLYALGATAYYALTKRHAYPATTFESLRNTWRSRPAPPSAHVPGIPKELDALVMSLLHLNALARPASAAEVMERLSALSGIPIAEPLVARQAYLSTPTLVGRDQALLAVRKQMARTTRGRGSTMLVTGEPGVGRSRFLEACVLEGKLAGALTLRADASDSSGGSWSVACSLLSQLMDSAPEVTRKAVAPRAPVLAHIWPELANRLQESEVEFEPKVFSGAQQQRAEMQGALLEVLCEVTASRPLLLVFDDLQRLDEPSKALAALVAHQARRSRLFVVAATECVPEDAESAVALFAAAGAALKLRNLTQEQTGALLRSVFGDTTNVSVLCERLFAVTHGNPRAIMQLSQHLLDNGTIGYQSGAFVVPEHLDATDLPVSLMDALRARAQRLSAGARELAQAIALSDQPALSLEECLLLSKAPREQVLLELDELAQHEIAQVNGLHYGLRHASWQAALLDGLCEQYLKRLHERVAALFERRGHAFHVARHAFAAGQRERGLQALLELVYHGTDGHRSDTAKVEEFVNALPPDWTSTCNEAIALCVELGRPQRDRFELQSSLVAYAAAKAKVVDEHLLEQLEQLRHDTGLDLYAALDPSLDEATRLGLALEQAQKRYEALPEEQRVLPPSEAIARLAQVIVLTIAAAGRSFERSLLARAPSLAPLTALSPALDLVEKNRQSTLHLLAGRVSQARQGYVEILEDIDRQPDLGIPSTMRQYMRMAIVFAVASIDVAAGVPAGIERAAELEDDPLFVTNVCRLRMLHALRQGDAQGAEHQQRQLELLRIRNSPPQLFDGSQAWSELLCHVTTEDLVRVMHLIPQVEAHASDMPAWQPCLHFARAQYHALRHDGAQALCELERAMAGVAPGQHVAWAPIAAAYVRALVREGRAADAVARGRAMLQEAAREEIDGLAVVVREALAVALCADGQYAEAVALSEEVIANFDSIGATGSLPGSAYETRARIALAMQDAAAFERYAALCAAAYRAGRNPALTGKYERLIQEASGNGLRVAQRLSGGADFTNMLTQNTLSKFSSLLSNCLGASERAEEALRALVEHSGCTGGFLYTIQKSGIALVAQHGGVRPPHDMDSQVSAFLAAEVDDSEQATATADFDAAASGGGRSWQGVQGERFVPMVLGHDTRDGFAITGVAVLQVGSGGTFTRPDELLRVLSRALFDAGDVTFVAAA